MNDGDEEVVQEEEEEVGQEDSLRDVIEEAYDESEEPTDGDDEAGEDAGGGVSGDDGDTGTAEVEATTTEAGDGEKVADTAPVKSANRVPAGWDAAAREHWDKIPEEVQAQISAREDEVARTIHGTLDARKTHEFLSNLSANYAPVLAAEGVGNPAEAIEGLFKTVSVLRLGSPQQKATQLADIIGTYGIDVGMLDSALSGQGFTNTPEGGSNANLEHMIDQKLGPINDVLQRVGEMEQGKRDQSQSNANQEVVDFSKEAEFLNDVREDMADLLDLASAQGRDMTLQEAYDKCCTMRPEIQSVLDERKNTQNLLDGKKKAAKKLNASSSIRGSGENGAAADGELSLRDQISSIWNDYEE